MINISRFSGEPDYRKGTSMSYPMIRVGLHNHTSASDGFFSPLQLVEQANLREYEWLAITDHNTVHGWLDLDLPPNVVGGIEMSGLCARSQTEVHLLGYGFSVTPELLDYSRQFFDHALQAWQETLLTLEAKWLPQTLEERPLAIQALIAAGIAPETILSEAGRIQGRYRRTGKAPDYLSYAEAIDLLHRAGGKVSLAHPQRYPQAVSEDLLERVDALEVYHPSHSPEIRDYWRSVAVRMDKQVTGGHDYHGWSKPHTLPEPLAMTDELFLSRP